MALAFAERRDGWPVGGELRGVAYSCPTPTVQIVRLYGKGAARYVVHTLFPFRRVDLRHPPSPALPLNRARSFALTRLAMFAGGVEHVQHGRGPGIDLTRGGKHIALEAVG